MAKKNLTDLLNEEVKKSSQPESKTVQQNTDDELIQNTQTLETLPMNTQDQANAKRAIPTKADLEATITELRAALKEAQNQEETFVDLKNALEEAYKKEGSLEQQITDLQSDLQHQKKLAHKLEKELEKLEPLKTELGQAKKAAVQLAQANEKLTQEINTLKKGNAPKQQESIVLKEPQSTVKEQEHIDTYHPPVRPIQKEADKPADFAKTSWLL